MQPHKSVLAVGRSHPAYAWRRELELTAALLQREEEQAEAAERARQAELAAEAARRRAEEGHAEDEDEENTFELIVPDGAMPGERLEGVTPTGACATSRAAPLNQLVRLDSADCVRSLRPVTCPTCPPTHESTCSRMAGVEINITVPEGAVPGTRLKFTLPPKPANDT